MEFFMNVICLEEDAFYSLIDRVLERVNASKAKNPDKWISGDEAMLLLRISSKTTLQKLRDEGKIRFSHPEKKHIVYDRESINEYLEKHAKDTF